jgi:hypothetical protein
MSTEVKLKAYGHDENNRYGWYVSDATVDTYALAKSMTPENVYAFLEDWVNNYSIREQVGHDLGVAITGWHRTLQASMVAVLLNALLAVGEQVYTDPRNERAVDICRRIGVLLKDEIYQGRLHIMMI